MQFLLKPFYLFKRRFPLLSYIVNRLFVMIVMLFLLGFAVFGLMALAPGDIFDQIMMQQLLNSEARTTMDNRDFTDEQMAAFRTEHGLDQPFYIQYFRWLHRVVVRGDLGVSLISRAPVPFLITSLLFNSLLLNLISLFMITVFSFILGVYFSSKAGTKTDLAVTFIALTLHAFPGLLLLILLQLFASATGLFPVTGYPLALSFSDAPAQFVFSYAHHIFLPLLAAFLGGIGGTLRMVRATMLDQLGQPYITNLRSRGIAEWRIYFHHAFRNTLNPYITGSANMLAGLFSGSLILEIIFAYPGIGRLMYDAVLQQDVNLVLANIMFISFLVLAGMAIADILLALVDPRIRYGKE
ncbi:MAG: ABC transporter permease [Treponema sp.]|nr:ABC transporter permease [Treponema sp.]